MSEQPANTMDVSGEFVDKAGGSDNISLVRNVSANWLWYMLVVLSGFLIPPMVDRHLGKQMLGIWDFGWALVLYVNWLQFGVTGAINRYVARYRAILDWEALNATVNSCLAMLLVSSTVGVLMVLGMSWLAPRFLSGLTPETMRTARLVVLLLGFTTLLGIISSAFNSVISGCERFDVLNLIRGSRDGLILIIMLVVLVSGGGLITMALVMLVSEALQSCAFMIAGRRLCPQIRFSSRYCSWKVVRETLGFGLKTVSQGFFRAVLLEINALLIVSYLGPASLAVFARQTGLVFSVLAFVRHYGYVLIPRTSQFDVRGNREGLQRLVALSSRYGFYITLPAILVLVIMGRPLLTLWMGEAYVAPLVLAVCALGNLPVIAQTATYSILMGMGRHGRLVIYGVCAGLFSAAIGFVSLKMGGGLLGPALGLAVALLVSDGILQPLYACRQVQLGFRRYLADVLPGPFLAAIPFAVFLLLARFLVPGPPWLTLLAGLIPGGVVLSVIYWLHVVPGGLKSQVRKRLSVVGLRREPWPVQTMDAATREVGG